MGRWNFCNGCENAGCLPDQQEWCRMQDLFMRENDAGKREALVWDFVASFRGLLRSLALKRLGKGGCVGADETVSYMTDLLYRRFAKSAAAGKYYMRKKLKGYLNACLGGEIVALARENRRDVSLDLHIGGHGEAGIKRLYGEE